MNRIIKKIALTTESKKFNNHLAWPRYKLGKVTLLYANPKSHIFFGKTNNNKSKPINDIRVSSKWQRIGSTLEANMKRVSFFFSHTEKAIYSLHVRKLAVSGK